MSASRRKGTAAECGGVGVDFLPGTIVSGCAACRARAALEATHTEGEDHVSL